MNKKEQLGSILALLIASCSTRGCCCGCVSKQIKDEFDHMEKIARNIGDWTYNVQRNIRDMFSHNPVQKKLSFSQDKKYVTIKLSLGEGITSFDGNIEPHQLTIEIPEAKQTIVVNYNKKTRFLSIGREQKKEIKKKNEKFYSSSYDMMQQGQTIEDPIDLEKSTFRYKDGKLIISIAKQVTEKKTPKKITVEMK